MKGILLTMKENNEYQLIKNFVDKGGNFNRLLVQLGCSERTVYRKIKGYKQHGKAFFRHGNHDKKTRLKITRNIENEIIEIYKSFDVAPNFTHFHEILAEHYPDIPDISLSSLRNIFKNNLILSPKARRETRKKYKKIEREMLKSTKDDKNIKSEIIKESIESSIDSNPHPHREKSKYIGEKIYLDASDHIWWIGEERAHLHIAVDDHTGIIMGAYFDKEETLNGYLNVTKQIIENYGVPVSFQTDGRSVFEYAAFKKKDITKDRYTQFGYICKLMGTSLTTVSIPEMQGPVERQFQTFQSRFPVEAEINGIKNIEEANEFLKKYIPLYNKRFGRPLDDSISSFVPLGENIDINILLSIKCKRIIDSGNAVNYKKKKYKLINENGKETYLRYKSEVLVIEAFDGEMYCTFKDEIYKLEEIKQYKEKSRMLDYGYEDEKEIKTPYIPPMDHPWRLNSFSNYVDDIYENKYKFEDLVNTEAIVYGMPLEE